MSKDDKRGAPKGSFGNVPYVRTDEVARQVEIMAGLGITQPDMESILQISGDTLARHYRAELDAGMAKAKFQLMERAHQMAMGLQVPEGVSKDEAYRIASKKVDFLLNVVHRVRPGTALDLEGGSINVTISADDAEL